MEKVILWDKDIEGCLIHLSESELDDFLELVAFIQEEHIRNYISEDTRAQDGLWEWLWSKEDIGLVDLKRELSRKIEKAMPVDRNEYNENRNQVGRNGHIKTLVLYRDAGNVCCISTIDEYYEGLRSYLAMEKKDEFTGDLEECFPNIYFSRDISAAINTLNRRFEDIREEIVEHLSGLDGYRDRFAELLLEHKSYAEIAQAFSSDTGIACSPQAGREGVQNLKETHYNNESRQEETVVCELHTKFRKFNINRKRQDRIYFFPGKQGIQGGRIIVKHIGDHM